MLRLLPFATLALAATLPALLGQAAESPTPALPTMASRLDSAMNDIAVLKRLVADQGQRIVTLERTIRVLQAPPSAAARTQVTWEGIKPGMSRAQVVELLGDPKFNEAVMDRQTLIYGPEVNNPVGRVTIVDDRVTQVEYPRGRIIVTPSAK